MLSTGIFSTAWKTILIAPCFKSGNLLDVRDDRLICIISTTPKLFKSLIVDIIKPSVARLVCTQQHGFISVLSTITNLSVYYNFVSTSLEHGNRIDIVLTYFKKAFETVAPNILASKLSLMSIYDLLLSSFKSYVTEPHRDYSRTHCQTQFI